MSRNLSETALTDEQAAAIAAGNCPDCSYRGFVLGPRGGAAISIECGGLDCRARFNVVRLPDGSMWGERIEKQSEGGSDWPP